MREVNLDPSLLATDQLRKLVGAACLVIRNPSLRTVPIVPGLIDQNIRAPGPKKCARVARFVCVLRGTM